MKLKATLLVLIWLSCAMSGRTEDVQAQFLAGVFAPVPPEQKLILSGEAEAEAGRIRSGRYIGVSIPYWRKADKTVWILQARAKGGLIQSAFVVQQEKIISSEVLRFKEHRGRQICSADFLSQFSGVSLRSDHQLNREIDGYTGATLTVGAMCDMARLALFFDSLVSGVPE